MKEGDPVFTANPALKKIKYTYEGGKVYFRDE